ncbi:MAG: hypothetical protein HPY55_16325 [Firmicutes bacterium]|nr:hypothetical protein [Bacillota bacterium]
MSGYKLCVAGGPIYEAQKAVTQLRHLGSRLHMAKSSPGLGQQAVGLQRDMVALADELAGLAAQIRDEAARVVIKL